MWEHDSILIEATFTAAEVKIRSSVHYISHGWVALHVG